MQSYFYRKLGAFPSWFFTVPVVIAILWLTLVPNPVPEIDVTFWEHTDKIVHAIMFGTLYFVVSIDWYRKRQKDIPRLWSPVSTTIFAWTALFGAIIELVQPYVGRSNDIYDFLADLAGIIIAGLVTPQIIILCRGH